MSDDPLALRSAALHRFFHGVFRRRARTGLRAVRLARWGTPEAAPGPLVVYANHPGWWDGIAFMLLSRMLFPDRIMVAPMAAEALARYPFMRRLGVFGVAPGPRGASAFLRTAGRVLATPGAMLWLNAPGRFQDARERPVGIIPTLPKLAEIAPAARFLPLALEYPFWGEARPELLAGFGAPVAAGTLLAAPREGRATALGAALEATMDRLATDALMRDPARFTTLLAGPEGMGGAYDVWRRLRAALAGRRFDPRHEQA